MHVANASPKFFGGSVRSERLYSSKSNPRLALSHTHTPTSRRSVALNWTPFVRTVFLNYILFWALRLRICSTCTVILVCSHIPPSRKQLTCAGAPGYNGPPGYAGAPPGMAPPGMGV